MVEIHEIQRLVLVEAAKNDAFLASSRINMPLQTLRANLLQHALHRRVDGSDGLVLRGKVRFQDCPARRLDRIHHPVRAD